MFIFVILFSLLYVAFILSQFFIVIFLLIIINYWLYLLLLLIFLLSFGYLSTRKLKVSPEISTSRTFQLEIEKFSSWISILQIIESRFTLVLSSFSLFLWRSMGVFFFFLNWKWTKKIINWKAKTNKDAVQCPNLVVVAISSRKYQIQFWKFYLEWILKRFESSIKYQWSWVDCGEYQLFFFFF